MSIHACIILDQDLCTNCKACEIHCAVWNGLDSPLGKHSGDLPYIKDGKMRLDVQFFPCMHCARPLCIKVCKPNAMFLTEDNTVLIDSEKCTGCGDCITACPTHVPQYNANTGKVIKCNLCSDRRAAGDNPACVTGCLAHALTLSDDSSVHKNNMKTQLKFIREFGK